MEWLLGLAVLPALFCGVMCVGGVVFAAVGIRRGTARRACCDAPVTHLGGGQERVTVER